jgi:hypothetical protein
MAPPDTPRPLAELLRGGSLAALVEEASERRALTAQARKWLSEEEGPHLVAASRDPDGVLVLTMDSAVWAARVRYRAGADGSPGLRVKVSPRSA